MKRMVESPGAQKIVVIRVIRLNRKNKWLSGKWLHFTTFFFNFRVKIMISYKLLCNCVLGVETAINQDITKKTCLELHPEASTSIIAWRGTTT